MTTLEILLLLFLISFVILIVLFSAIFVVIVAIFKSFRNEAGELLHEVTSLVEETKEVTSDVHKKLQYFDPLLGALSNLGKGLEAQSARYRDHQYSLESQPVPSDEELQISDFVRFALLGVELWLTMKKRRSSDA